MNTNSLLIDNATILTLGETPRVLESHSLLVEDGRIAAISPAGAITAHAGRTIDAHGCVVMPGLINAHMHFYSTFARGYTKASPSTNFSDILKNLWWELDRALTTEDCYLSAIVACVNAIRSGTTTIIDHHASPNAVEGSLDSIARATREAGLRACLCYEVSDRDGGEIARRGLSENAAFIRQCASAPDDHVKALFGLHAAFTLSDATLETAHALASELQTGFHLHVAEAASDQEYSIANHGMRVVERLEKRGILGRKTIAAHGVHLSDNEMDILAQTDTAVVHNPQSNLNNAVGIADIPAMHRHCICVGLGTDAMTVNMFEELRSALWCQHFRNANPSVGFGEVTRMLFRGNPLIAQRIWQLPLGELRAGAPADLILIPYNAPTPLNDESQFGHLVFGLSQESVDTTIVGGRVLMANRRLELDIDEEWLSMRARERAAEVWATM